MKLRRKLAIVLSSFAMLGSSAMADYKSVSCQNDDGYVVEVEYSYETSLGTLTYGYEGALQQIDEVDVALEGGFGAVLKGSEALLTISPAPGKKLGEFIVAGETISLVCQ